MSIQFNKVTWYSKLAALIVLVATVFLALYFRGEFKKISQPVQSNKTVSATGDVALAVGETAIFDGLQISFDGMIQDNRCPIDVVCIEGGAVTARVTMRSADKVEERNFPSDEVPYKFDGYSISIVRAAPTRYSKVDIDPKSYIIVFHIAKDLKQ
jgi:hypothetical protein